MIDLTVEAIVYVVAGAASMLGAMKGKDYLQNGKTKKNGTVCPIIHKGGTPMTKEEHNETCSLKMELVDEKLEHLREGQERNQKSQAVMKDDIKEILRKMD